LENYGLAQQMKRDVPISEMIANTGDYAEAILCISQTLPLPRIALLLLAVTMVISVYSYKKIKADAEPDKRIKTFWAVVFILFPIALIFSEESMYRLQSVSIIAAFPIGIVIVLIIISFFKDAHRILHEK
jgi:choline/carnitine/betaine transporter